MARPICTRNFTHGMSSPCTTKHCLHAQVSNEGGKVDEPMQCVRCKTKSAFELMHNQCMFSNKQLVKMQEKPNDIPEGETPHGVVGVQNYVGMLSECALMKMQMQEKPSDIPER